MDDIYNELMHFGVLGMHWGHRKAQTSVDKKQEKFGRSDLFRARRKFRKSDKKNYDTVSKIYGKKLARTQDDEKYNKLYFQGLKMVQKAKLMDAGMTEKKAEIGAQWLEKHNFNINFSDAKRMNDYRMNSYD